MVNAVNVEKRDTIQEPVQNNIKFYIIIFFIIDINMEWRQQMRKHQEVSNDAMYHNTRTTNVRQIKQTLLVDVVASTMTDTTTKFNIELHEPLIIDSLSDIYLDSFTTFKAYNNRNPFSTALPAAQSSQPNSLIFFLEIDQFNIKTSSNDALLWNKIIIPNESTSVTNIGTYVHKSKKMNYICSINPTILKNITGSLMNQESTTIMNDVTNGRFIAEFVIISRK